MVNIRKLEKDLWEAADLLRSGSKLTSNEYCKPVLGLIFLRYAYTRYKKIDKAIKAERAKMSGRVPPIEDIDYTAHGAINLPKEAQYEYIAALPHDIAGVGVIGIDKNTLNTLGEVVNNAFRVIEEKKPQLKGLLPNEYTEFSNDVLFELIQIFNNAQLDEATGDVIGRIYEYFLNKFAKNIASDDGVFFTPKSLVKMIVAVIEPKRGLILDPACGSGGMFVEAGEYVKERGEVPFEKLTLYGQEKVEYNAALCLMNLAVHGLPIKIKSGNEANTFYRDAFNLEGGCDFVMANPPFNVDKVKSESCMNARRLPFGYPAINKQKEFGNANYLWIQYFYSYLNNKGRAGFVMASSATDSQGKDKDIRALLINSGAVDVIISVGNNFFYTKSLPCSLWFFNKAKDDDIKDKILFIDARNYYTVVDRTLNEWTAWQLKNLTAVVNLYRGERDKYENLISEYKNALGGEGDFSRVLEKTQEKLDTARKIEKEWQEKRATKKDARKEKRDALIKCQAEIETLTGTLKSAKEALWLTKKFGEDGTYKDISGLCKIASIEEIADKGYSLTPGAYVGVEKVLDDGVDFNKRMHEIQGELATLQEESNKIMSAITKNWEEIRG